MISKLVGFFSDKIDLQKDQTPANEKSSIRIATCALLIEMASIDEEFDDVERKRIVDYFKSEYGLPDSDIEELFDLSRKQLDSSIDLWGFTNLINKHYDKDQKIKVIEMIWEVVYADGKLSAHEDYLVHKFYKMLNLAHGDMIDAKMRVLERSKK